MERRLTETKNHPKADLTYLRLSDDMIELLKSRQVDSSLLCELAAHPDFSRPMTDLEKVSLAFIYKRLKLEYGKLTEDKKKCLKDFGEVRLAEKFKPTAEEEIKILMKSHVPK